MITVLWMLFAFAVVFLLLSPIAICFVFGYAWSENRRVADIASLVLKILLTTGYLLTFIGGISGILLAVFLDQTKARVSTGGVGGIMLSLGLLPTRLLWHELRRRSHRRTTW